MREPILKAVHTLRAFEAEGRLGQEIELVQAPRYFNAAGRGAPRVQVACFIKLRLRLDSLGWFTEDVHLAWG